MSLLTAVALIPVSTLAVDTTTEISVSQKHNSKKGAVKKKTTQNSYSGITIEDFGYKSGVKTISAFIGASMYVEFTFSKDGALIKATYSGRTGEGKLTKAQVKNYANEIANEEIPTMNIDITRY